MRALFSALIVLAIAASGASANPRLKYWANGEWQKTDFSKHSVDLSEIVSGGPPKDGIPPIDDPMFESLEAAAERLAPLEPVIGLAINGEAKAYPLSILIWHEIVNDEIGGVPVAVTYCPLCNSAVVFDRRVGDRVLDFGTTGKLRMSDLVMWDRQTESWWQQFLGEAIVGEMTGTRLRVLAARTESFERFQRRRPDGVVLRPSMPQLRAYGRNPYVKYDSAPWPFLYRGESPEGIPPLARVIAVGERAWSLDLLRRRGEIKADGMMLVWEPGQASALDTEDIRDGRDIGNVVVRRMAANGPVDVAHDITFVFAFHGFRPKGEIFVHCEAGTTPKPPLFCG